MIPGLPQVGGMELIILLTVVLLFFGAKRIPELARSLGKGTREFREGMRAGAAENDKDEVRGGGEDKDEQRAALAEAEQQRGETAPRTEEAAGATRSGQKA